MLKSLISILTFCFSSILYSQDSLNVISKEIKHYNEKNELVKNASKATYRITNYFFKNNIHLKEKVRLKDSLVLTQHYFKEGNPIGTWKEYNPSYGSVNIQMNPIEYCPEKYSENKTPDSLAIPHLAAFNRMVGINANYPAIARQNGIMGEVYVHFSVDQLGYIQAVCIAKGVHPSLDLESFSLIQFIHKFYNPEKIEGNKEFELLTPVSFSLR